jgi:hypothetical protein
VVAETKTISSDGWVGNPNMIVDEEERFTGRFFTFGGFALARRIFFSGFLALTLLFIGALFLSQIQNDVFDEKRDNVEIHITLVKELMEQKLIARGGTQDTEALLGLFQELPRYPAVDAYLYDPNLIEIWGNPSAIYETEAGRSLLDIENEDRVGIIRTVIGFISRFGARLGPRDAEAFRDLVAVQVQNGDEGLMTATTPTRP